MLTAVTGINWGDEGKGRVIDQLSEHADIVARYQGGNNAGHTVVVNGQKYILNLLPSGILHPDVVCVLGTGMVIDLTHLSREIQSLRDKGIPISVKNLKISDRAVISMPWHKLQDELEEDRLARNGSAFGSTRRGIAYAYGDKYRKKVLRMGDLKRFDDSDVQNRLNMMLEAKNLELSRIYGQPKERLENLSGWLRKQAEQFAPYICDTHEYLSEAHAQGKNILLEAQLGAMRDIDFGIFPFTSSSSTIAAYAPIGAGIPGQSLDHVVGVLKAYSTCVGAGPFAAEKAMDAGWLEALRKSGGEYGAATGRPRRVGPFDVVASRYGLRCQNADKIALTKLDVLSSLDTIPVITGYQFGDTVTDIFSPLANLEEAAPIVEMLPGWKCDISRCRSWDDLPEAAKNYIRYLEDALAHEIQFISVGAQREEFLLKGAWL